MRWCEQSTADAALDGPLDVGVTAFVLVTAVEDGIEGSLGADAARRSVITGRSPPVPGSATTRLLFGDACAVEWLDAEDLSTRRIAGNRCSVPERG